MTNVTRAELGVDPDGNIYVSGPSGLRWRLLSSVVGGGSNDDSIPTLIRSFLQSLNAGHQEVSDFYPYNFWFDADANDYTVCESSLYLVCKIFAIDVEISEIVKLLYSGTKPSIPSDARQMLVDNGADIDSFPDVGGSHLTFFAGTTEDPNPDASRYATLSFAGDSPVPMPTEGFLEFDTIDNEFDPRFTLTDGVLTFDPGEDGDENICIMNFTPSIDAFYP